ncbi:MAG TPA: VOC family protein [Caulobacteraceae bacterium]|jgi:catechol 2,3-dioxygenase-like lactoylglutathione lyase family enzyme|nr:VOC family protein [Caulobacteraceae bacterium]
MLSEHRLVAFLGTADAAAARAFYEGVQGLTLAGDHEHLMLFDAGPARIALQKDPRITPKGGTSVGWNVPDVRAQVRDLMARGVVFDRYDGMQQDDLAIWSPVAGEGVAWFKDPDGKLLPVNGPLGG